MARLKEKYGLLIIGILIGIAYGIATRIVFGERASLATVTYLFVVPAILGMVPLLFANEHQLRSYRYIIFIPWLTVGSVLLTMVMMGLEQWMCFVILAAPFVALATLGAFIIRLIQLHLRQRKGKLLTLLLIPFLLSPVEELITSPSSIFSVTSEVDVKASTHVIWQNIIEVDSIRGSEYKPGVFNSLGIPRPINAVVDRKAVDGHRVGNFEGGLRFDETLTAYEENRSVSFLIKVDPRSVGPGVFEQHVLNGSYFSFVQATYQLTPQPDGNVKLTLTSSYQLTSKINFYGKLWGDWVLKDFQDRLLAVIQKRSESL